MSEYWKSTPKYWCKHCSTYVKDTPFERKQHEATGRHQGNLKRSLRTIQNDHERSERDKQYAKAEVERLNRVVGGNASAPMPPGSTTATQKPASAPQSAVDQKRQWAQLAQMGIQVPDTYRSEMAMAGDWRVVSQQPADEPTAQDSLSIGVRKRKFEGQEEEEEAGETVVRRGWGSTTKRYPGQDAADLDSLLSSGIVLKPKSTVKEESTNIKSKSTTTAADDNAPNPSYDDKVGSDHDSRPSRIEGVKSEDEDQAETAKLPIKAEIPEDETSGTTASRAAEARPPQPAIPVFKKRRPKVAATS